MNEPPPSGTPPSVEGIVTRPSPFSVEETLARLLEAIRSRKLNLFAHIDHSGEAKRVGLKIQEAHVLIFGNPKGGTPLMIASPLLALDLPLKALVWQSEDGRVWVSSTSAAQSANAQAMLESVLRGVTVGEVMNPKPATVPANVSLQQLVDEYFLPGGLRYALVMQGEQLVGLITLSDIRHVPREQWAQISVSEAIVPLERLHVATPQQRLSDMLPLSHAA
jgi:uncharacterized protein (DUF302 family)